jgi:hypothetical protein
MMTDLPVGAVLVMTHRGEQQLWVVCEDRDGKPGAYTGAGRPLQPGETVHRVVWKGDTIVVRRTYILKSGDVEWVDTGVLSLDGKSKVFTNRLRRRI